MITAVVFDCDGVLVDSEPLADIVWSRVLADRGYTMTDADAAACRGTTERATYAYFARRADLEPYDAHISAIDALRVPLYEERLEAFPDAVETVRSLAAAGTALGVASSSRGAALRSKLAMVGLDRYFGAVVGGDEVGRGKPAPDVYLEAARRLGVDPSACLAIEDVDLGADAASAAGMRTVIVARDGSVSARHATVALLSPDLLAAWLA